MNRIASAAASGRWVVGDIGINRLGFGAMRITGDGVWGAPKDVRAARETLCALRELGVDFIDTADSYGPFVSEELIRETLHPYQGMLIGTKGGFLRTGPNEWTIDGKPEHLRQCVLMSMWRLGVERIDLWQLHRIDPAVPRAEQFGEIARMRDEGLIRHVGLSEVTVADIQEAQGYFPVVTVQNRYNMTDRKSEGVLEFCDAHGIGFIPWFPLAAGDVARRDSPFSRIAQRLGVSMPQLALAWLLKRAANMLPIPGTTNPQHLRENVEAASIVLSDEDIREIDVQARA